MIIHSVATRDELRSSPIAPPAMAYCREDGNYYLKFAYVKDFVDTPYYSGIGNGWHNMDVSSPEFDRPIHVIHTQWLNGWNLDYYPDYINTLATARGMGELEGIFGHHYGSEDNTEIENLNPGDFIFRTQNLYGTIAKSHGNSDRIIHVDGLEIEIPDKVFSSRNIPLQEDAFGAYGSCAKLIINNKEYWILEHYPNSRTEDPHPDGGYPCEFDEENQTVNCKNLGDEYSDHPAYDDSRFNSIWKPLGQPTTKVFINQKLDQTIEEGTEFKIEVREWYIVSCEILDLCEGHKQQTWDYLSIAGADAPARFTRKIHSIKSESDLLRLYLSKKCIPGDLAYNELDQTWYQILSPFFGVLEGEYSKDYTGTISISGLPNIFQGNCYIIIEDEEYSLKAQDDEHFEFDEPLKKDHSDKSEVMVIYLPFADLTRILPINDTNHFNELAQYFTFHNLFLCNLTNSSQAYKQRLPKFSGEYDIEWEDWSRNLYPAELLYED